VSVLLAALPYAAAIIVNWLIVSDAFRPGADDSTEAASYGGVLLAPVAIGGLTPVALAAHKGVSSADQQLLWLATALALLFCGIAQVALSGGQRARRLQHSLSLGPVNLDWLPGWRLVLLLGSALLVFAAIISVIVDGH
jgi:hypothetical protein